MAKKAKGKNMAQIAKGKSIAKTAKVSLLVKKRKFVKKYKWPIVITAIVITILLAKYFGYLKV